MSSQAVGIEEREKVGYYGGVTGMWVANERTFY
jgi:hypothetical protein